MRRIIIILLVVLLFITSGDSIKVKYRRVCYYTNWSQYREGLGKFLPEDIQPDLCTHIIFAFAKIEGNYLTSREWNDESVSWRKGLYERVNSLKRRNKSLQTLLSVGGWSAGSEPFIKMASSASGRKQFAVSSIDFLRENDFDGLDIDWEFPGRDDPSTAVKEKQYLTLLLKELRNAFNMETRTNNRKLLLSIAVPAGKQKVDLGYDVPSINKYVDMINLMSYNFHGTWETSAGHHSALFEDKNNHDFSVAGATHYWVELGAEPKKINLGLPLYGRGYTLKYPSRNSIGAPIRSGSANGRYTNEAGFLSYYEICDMIKRGANVRWDKKRRVPYTVLGNQWVGYDNERSLRAKVRWLKSYTLGGIMVWALPLDDFKGSSCTQSVSFPLLRAVKTELLKPQGKTNIILKRRRFQVSTKKRNSLNKTTPSLQKASSTTVTPVTDMTNTSEIVESGNISIHKTTDHPKVESTTVVSENTSTVKLIESKNKKNKDDTPGKLIPQTTPIVSTSAATVGKMKRTHKESKVYIETFVPMNESLLNTSKDEDTETNAKYHPTPVMRNDPSTVAPIGSIKHEKQNDTVGVTSTVAPIGSIKNEKQNDTVGVTSTVAPIGSIKHEKQNDTVGVTSTVAPIGSIINEKQNDTVGVTTSFTRRKLLQFGGTEGGGGNNFGGMLNSLFGMLSGFTDGLGPNDRQDVNERTQQRQTNDLGLDQSQTFQNQEALREPRGRSAGARSGDSRITTNRRSQGDRSRDTTRHRMRSNNGEIAASQNERSENRGQVPRDRNSFASERSRDVPRNEFTRPNSIRRPGARTESNIRNNVAPERSREVTRNLLQDNTQSQNVGRGGPGRNNQPSDNWFSERSREITRNQIQDTPGSSGNSRRRFDDASSNRWTAERSREITRNQLRDNSQTSGLDRSGSRSNGEISNNWNSERSREILRNQLLQDNSQTGGIGAVDSGNTGQTQNRWEAERSRELTRNRLRESLTRESLNELGIANNPFPNRDRLRIEQREWNIRNGVEQATGTGNAERTREIIRNQLRESPDVTNSALVSQSNIEPQSSRGLGTSGAVRSREIFRNRADRNTGNRNTGVSRNGAVRNRINDPRSRDPSISRASIFSQLRDPALIREREPTLQNLDLNLLESSRMQDGLRRTENDINVRDRQRSGDSRLTRTRSQISRPSIIQGNSLPSDQTTSTRNNVNPRRRIQSTNRSQQTVQQNIGQRNRNVPRRIQQINNRRNLNANNIQSSRNANGIQQSVNRLNSRSSRRFQTNRNNIRGQITSSDGQQNRTFLSASENRGIRQRVNNQNRAINARQQVQSQSRTNINLSSRNGVDRQRNNGGNTAGASRIPVNTATSRRIPPRSGAQLESSNRRDANGNSRSIQDLSSASSNANNVFIDGRRRTFSNTDNSELPSRSGLPGRNQFPRNRTPLRNAVSSRPRSVIRQEDSIMNNVTGSTGSVSSLESSQLEKQRGTGILNTVNRLQNIRDRTNVAQNNGNINAREVFSHQGNSDPSSSNHRTPANTAIISIIAKPKLSATNDINANRARIRERLLARENGNSLSDGNFASALLEQPTFQSDVNANRARVREVLLAQGSNNAANTIPNINQMISGSRVSSVSNGTIFNRSRLPLTRTSTSVTDNAINTISTNQNIGNSAGTNNIGKNRARIRELLLARENGNVINNIPETNQGVTNVRSASMQDNIGGNRARIRKILLARENGKNVNNIPERSLGVTNGGSPSIQGGSGGNRARIRELLLAKENGRPVNNIPETRQGVTNEVPFPTQNDIGENRARIRERFLARENGNVINSIPETNQGVTKGGSVSIQGDIGGNRARIREMLLAKENGKAVNSITKTSQGVTNGGSPSLQGDIGGNRARIRERFLARENGKAVNNIPKTSQGVANRGSSSTQTDIKANRARIRERFLAKESGNIINNILETNHGVRDGGSLSVQSNIKANHARTLDRNISQNSNEPVNSVSGSNNKAAEQSQPSLSNDIEANRARLRQLLQTQETNLASMVTTNNNTDTNLIQPSAANHSIDIRAILRELLLGQKNSTIIEIASTNVDSNKEKQGPNEVTVELVLAQENGKPLNAQVTGNTNLNANLQIVDGISAKIQEILLAEEGKTFTNIVNASNFLENSVGASNTTIMTANSNTGLKLEQPVPSDASLPTTQLRNLLISHENSNVVTNNNGANIKPQSNDIEANRSKLKAKLLALENTNVVPSSHNYTVYNLNKPIPDGAEANRAKLQDLLLAKENTNNAKVISNINITPLQNAGVNLPSETEKPGVSLQNTALPKPRENTAGTSATSHGLQSDSLRTKLIKLLQLDNSQQLTENNDKVTSQSVPTDPLTHSNGNIMRNNVENKGSFAMTPDNIEISLVRPDGVVKPLNTITGNTAASNNVPSLPQTLDAKLKSLLRAQLNTNIGSHFSGTQSITAVPNQVIENTVNANANSNSNSMASTESNLLRTRLLAALLRAEEREREREILEKTLSNNFGPIPLGNTFESFANQRAAMERILSNANPSNIMAPAFGMSQFNAQGLLQTPENIGNLGMLKDIRNFETRGGSNVGDELFPHNTQSNVALFPHIRTLPNNRNISVLVIPLNNLDAPLQTVAAAGPSVEALNETNLRQLNLNPIQLLNLRSHLNVLAPAFPTMNNFHDNSASAFRRRNKKVNVFNAPQKLPVAHPDQIQHNSSRNISVDVKPLRTQHKSPVVPAGMNINQDVKPIQYNIPITTATPLFYEAIQEPSQVMPSPLPTRPTPRRQFKIINNHTVVANSNKIGKTSKTTDLPNSEVLWKWAA